MNPAEQKLFKACRVRPPVAGEVHVFALTLAPVVYKTPAAWRDRLVRFYATGTSYWIVWGSVPGISIDLSQRSVRDGSTFEIKPTTLGAAPVVANSWLDFEPDTQEAYFCILGAAAADLWIAHLSDNGVTYQMPAIGP